MSVQTPCYAGIVSATEYHDDERGYGWVVLCMGVIELAVGCGVFVKNQFSRWVGVIVLACNALAQLLMMPA